MDLETLTFLLGGGHLNVPERQARGIWPHPPLKFWDLVDHIVSALESKGYFPRPWTDDSVVGVIERRSPNHYIFRSIGEIGVGREEYCEQSYVTAKAAVRDYLRINFGLPQSGNLDSWKVVFTADGL